MRPSEIAALRVRDTDLVQGVLFVRGSRVLRQDGPSTKTKSAVRRVGIDETTMKVLEPLIPLHPDPAAYLFHAPEGGPIDQDKVNRFFCDTQRVLGIRVRGLYATKDTFCSIYLSNGGRIEWLSQQTGVAEGTLRKHYANYLRRRDDDAAELAKLTAKSERRVVKIGSKKG
jgi:integrase